MSPNTSPHSQVWIRSSEKCQGWARYTPRGPTRHPQQKSKESLNCNNFNIHYIYLIYWSWNYRRWHQTCLPIDTHKEIQVLLIPITKHGCPVLFLVTASLRQDWVICAPAAFLKCGSRFFSGSLSGIKCSNVPFPVIATVRQDVTVGNW